MNANGMVMKNEMDLCNMQFMVWQIHAMSMRCLSGGRRMREVGTRRLVLPAKYNSNERNLYAKQGNKMIIVGKIDMKTKEVTITADTEYTRSGNIKKSKKWRWVK